MLSSSVMPKPIEICIVDIDSCLLSNSNPTQDSLCLSLINHIKNSHYTGYYFCTHRCVQTTFRVTLEAHQVQCFAGLSNFNPVNTFLTAIKANFEKEVGLACLGISTSEDQGVSKLGEGFKNFLTPYENKLKELNADLINNKATTGYVDLTPEEKNEISKASPTFYKNDELIKIMKDAVEKFPGVKIIFSFFDDQQDIVLKSLEIDIAAISPNIALKAYRHVSHRQIFLQYMGSIGQILSPQLDSTSPASSTSALAPPANQNATTELFDILSIPKASANSDQKPSFVPIPRFFSSKCDDEPATDLKVNLNLK